MNVIHPATLEKANEAAVYTLYLYLAHKTQPENGALLGTVVSGLTATAEKEDWSSRDLIRLRTLKNAVEARPEIANSKLSDLICSPGGSTACAFTNPKGNIFVLFRGTGDEEWLDNGQGLSGIPEENTYLTYGENGEIKASLLIEKDFASGQQVEALNWFNRIAAENRWTEKDRITIAGHSKGGNKAQFVTIHSDLVDDCFSFDGQGFSPEALAAFKDRAKGEFTARRNRIISISSENDYVNVLGQRLMPDTQIYYFQSRMGIHFLEAMLDSRGYFLPQGEQGRLSEYMQNVSQRLIQLKPGIRQYVALGVMNVFQQYLGKEKAETADRSTLEKTFAGMTKAVDRMLKVTGFLQ